MAMQMNSLLPPTGRSQRKDPTFFTCLPLSHLLFASCVIHQTFSCVYLTVSRKHSNWQKGIIFARLSSWMGALKTLRSAKALTRYEAARGEKKRKRKSVTSLFMSAESCYSLQSAASAWSFIICQNLKFVHWHCYSYFMQRCREKVCVGDDGQQTPH